MGPESEKRGKGGSERRSGSITDSRLMVVRWIHLLASPLLPSGREADPFPFPCLPLWPQLRPDNPPPLPRPDSRFLRPRAWDAEGCWLTRQPSRPWAEWKRLRFAVKVHLALDPGFMT